MTTKFEDCAMRIAIAVEKRHGTTVCFDASDIIVTEIKALFQPLEELLPLELVSGDAVKRINPHAGQVCNSSISWAVTQPSRSHHRLSTVIEKLNKFIEE